MSRREASAVVATPLDEVERRLRDVPSWVEFLAGGEGIEQVSDERYVFALTGAHRTRRARVAVRAHSRDHRLLG